MQNLFLILFTLIVTSQSVFADEAFNSSIKNALKHSANVSYFSVAVSLVFVVFLIYLTGIIYAKLNVLGQKTAKRQYKDLGDSRIIIHSTTSIGTNKSLHVIEIAGKKLLIGVTNESITLIKDLDGAQNIDNSNQVSLTKELSKTLPLDKIYPQNVKNEENEINIENNIPNEEDENPNPEYNTDEFGIYKKYL